jgi:hypothetical protein
MSLEVYLLSIPLARHRSIVPRHRGSRVLDEQTAVRLPEPRVRDVAAALVEPPVATSTPQRLDRG